MPVPTPTHFTPAFQCIHLPVSQHMLLVCPHPYCSHQHVQLHMPVHHGCVDTCGVPTATLFTSVFCGCAHTHTCLHRLFNQSYPPPPPPLSNVQVTWSPYTSYSEVVAVWVLPPSVTFQCPGDLVPLHSLQCSDRNLSLNTLCQFPTSRWLSLFSLQCSDRSLNLTTFCHFPTLRWPGPLTLVTVKW